MNFSSSCVVFTSLWLGLLAGAAGAAQISQPRPVLLGQAPAFAVRVSLAERGTTLSDILDRLEQTLGARVRVEDRRLADRKLIVYCDRQPLGDLLDRIADIVGGEWTPDLRGGYELTETAGARRYARRYRRERQEEQQRLRRAQLQRYRELLRVAQENARRVMEGDPDPESRRFLDLENVDLMALLGRLTPEQVEQLFSAGEAAQTARIVTESGSIARFARYSRKPAFSIPVSGLPTEDQTRIDRWLQARADGSALGEKFARLRSDRDKILHFGNLDGASVDLVLTSPATPMWGPDVTLAFAGLLSPDPDHPLNKGLDQDTLRVLHRNVDEVSDVFPRRAGRVAELSDEDARVLIRLPLEGPPTHPLSLPEVLQMLHEQTGRAVVADYFTKPHRYRPTEETVALPALLRGVAEAFGRQISTAAPTITIRSPTWPDDERSEVPWRTLHPWLEAAREKNFLPAEHWLEMGRLSESQRLSLCAPSDLFGSLLVQPAREAVGAHYALTFHQALSTLQRRRAEAAELRWAHLRPDQQQLLMEIAVRTRGPRVTPLQLVETFRFSVRRAEPDVAAVRRGEFQGVCGINLHIGDQLIAGHYLLNLLPRRPPTAPPAHP
jgi:hypothetical protein